MTRWAIKPPPRLAVTDTPTDRALTSLRDTATRLAQVPLMDAEQIDGIELADEVTTAIPHTLGRAWKGWTICDEVNGMDPGRIRRLAGGNDAKELILRAYGFGETITISLLVW